MSDIAAELAALDRLSTGDLAERYAELHGQPCRTRHRAYLIRKIAWRIQANAEGDLSERARRRAAELADDADVRVMAPRTMVCPPQVGENVTIVKAATAGGDEPNDPRLPAPGSVTGRRGRSFHRYYRCTHAIKNGREGCSSGTLPASEIERVVVDEVRALASDGPLMAQVLTEANAAITQEIAGVRRDRDDVRRECARHERELQQLVASGKMTPEATGRIADLHTRLLAADQRLPELDSRSAVLEGQTVTEAEARAVFADFDGLWKSLIPREQARLLKLLLVSVEYDGDAGIVSVTFRPTSIRSLTNRKLEGAA